jgi:hypothetical protein
MRVYVTPRPGLSIRDPLNPAVRFPAEGDWREDATAYRRLEAKGDVTISTKAPTAKAASAKKES